MFVIAFFVIAYIDIQTITDFADDAEFIGKIRKIMDDNKVCWQTAELGRVDLGGGGTIAYICALYGMEVIDSGVAVLNMHAPLEIISKADLYEAAKAYRAFMLEA